MDAGEALALGDAYGEALAFGEADGDGVLDAFGEAEDDGLGEAEAADLTTPVSWRAPSAWPVPPDLLAFELALDDGLDAGVDDDLALGDDEGLGLDDGVGVGIGAGRLGVLDAAAGSPAPAGCSPGLHPTLLGTDVVHKSTCLNRSDADFSSGLICVALAPGIEMLMSCEPCLLTEVLLMPSPLNRLSRMEIAVFMSVVLGTPPLSATALSVTSVPPCRSRPSRTLN